MGNEYVQQAIPSDHAEELLACVERLRVVSDFVSQALSGMDGSDTAAFTDEEGEVEGEITYGQLLDDLDGANAQLNMVYEARGYETDEQTYPKREV